MSTETLKIGPKIKAFRRQVGLQANKFAEDLGISPSYLNVIENGKKRMTDLFGPLPDPHKGHNHK